MGCSGTLREIANASDIFGFALVGIVVSSKVLAKCPTPFTRAVEFVFRRGSLQSFHCLLDPSNVVVADFVVQSCNLLCFCVRR